jgi:LacI family transcriptional regulator
LRIGVCIPEEIHFFYDQMRAGIFDEAARTTSVGVEIVYRPVPRLGEGERKRIASLVKGGVQALIVTPGNPLVTTPSIDEAEERHVRVVCISTDAPASRRSTVVCVEPEQNGRLAAELMGHFFPPAARVAIVTGMLTTEDHRRKTEGFVAGYREHCPGGEVVCVVEAHESEAETFRKTVDLLARHRDVAGLYVNTVNSLPVCRALAERGLASKVHLITTDLFREMVPHFQAGTIGASIYQDPYLQGQTAVRILLDHLIGGASIPTTSYLNPGIVLRSNLRLFREATGSLRSRILRPAAAPRLQTGA